MFFLFSSRLSSSPFPISVLSPRDGQTDRRRDDGSRSWGSNRNRGAARKRRGVCGGGRRVHTGSSRRRRRRRLELPDLHTNTAFWRRHKQEVTLKRPLGCFRSELERTLVLKPNHRGVFIFAWPTCAGAKPRVLTGDPDRLRVSSSRRAVGIACVSSYRLITTKRRKLKEDWSLYHKSVAKTSAQTSSVVVFE